MNIEELQTFVEIADAGGISTAALRLGVSKSIVSRRLARLEMELGAQLITRSTRGTSIWLLSSLESGGRCQTRFHQDTAIDE